MLKFVTATGFDEDTNEDELISLSEKYPIEWGVLLSANNKTKRYANSNVFSKIENIKSKNPNIKFSLHVCGKDLLLNIIKFGKWNFIDKFNLNLDLFSRIQLNVGNIFNEFNHDVFFKSEDLLYLKQEIILQVNQNKIELCGNLFDRIDSSLNLINVLYDASSGNGILPDSWIHSDRYCGYAGGLSPDNVKSNLIKINKSNGGNFWIDAETSFRTNDVFDLSKVKNFIQNCFES